MGIWEILGIAPTRDRAAIEQAYAQQRRFADPQLDPENWQRLQKAYQEALRAASGEQPEQAESPSPRTAQAASEPPRVNVSPEAEMRAGQVMTELESLYSNPAWRNDMQRWRAQLEGERAHKEGVSEVLRVDLMGFLARQAQTGEAVLSPELLDYLSERLEWPRYRGQLEQQLGETAVSRVLGSPLQHDVPEDDAAMADQAEGQAQLPAQGFGIALIGWVVALMILTMVFGELMN